ncbi:MAG: hypothetical protein ACRCTS_07185 [Fusobacteriaceae bacterium]
MILLIIVFLMYLMFSRGKSSVGVNDKKTKIFLGVIITVLTISFVTSQFLPRMGFLYGIDHGYGKHLGGFGSFFRRCF